MFCINKEGNESETQIVGVSVNAKGFSSTDEMYVTIGCKEGAIAPVNASSLERYPMINLMNCFFAFVAIDKLFELCSVGVETAMGTQKVIDLSDVEFETQKFNARSCKLSTDEVHFIGHRGAGENSTSEDDEYVENTEFAIKKAIRSGVECVEIDAQLTKDDVLVVLHNFTIEYEGKKRSVSSLTYEEVKEAHRLAFNPKNRDDLCLLTLEKALSVSGEAGVNVEIKYPLIDELKEISDYVYVHPKTYVEKILEVIRASGKEKIYFSTFNPQIVFALCVVSHSYPIFFLTEGDGGKNRETVCNSMDAAIKFALRLGISGIIMDSKHLFSSDTDFSKIGKDTGLQFLAYGKELNNLESARIAISRGLCGLILDDIQIIAKLRDERVRSFN